MHLEQIEPTSGQETPAAPGEPNRPPLWAYLIPNGLSASRLVLAVLFPLVPLSWRAAIVLIAGASDLLDGYLCRRWHSTSTFGRLIDPIADKAFVLTVLATLLVEGVLTWPAVILLGLRDWAVLAGTAWLVAKRDWPGLCRLPPNWWGKAATNTQFAYLVLLLTGLPYSNLLFPITVALSGAAAVTYTHNFLRSQVWRQVPHARTPGIGLPSQRG